MWSEVAKQLHLPLRERTEIWIKVQSMKNDWEIKTWQFKQFGVDISGKSCVCRRWVYTHTIAVVLDYIYPSCYHCCHAAHIPSAKISLNCRHVLFLTDLASTVANKERSQVFLHETKRLPIGQSHSSFLRHHPLQFPPLSGILFDHQTGLISTRFLCFFNWICRRVPIDLL